jgi:hypothetical protein
MGCLEMSLASGELDTPRTSCSPSKPARCFQKKLKPLERGMKTIYSIRIFFLYYCLNETFFSQEGVQWQTDKKTGQAQQAAAPNPESAGLIPRTTKTKH